MAVCPVCDASVPDAEVERHVNAHFDGEDDGGDSGTGTGGGGGHGGDADGDDFEFEITGDSGIPQYVTSQRWY
jgi:hypothetical protein